MDYAASRSRRGRYECEDSQFVGGLHFITVYNTGGFATAVSNGGYYGHVTIQKDGSATSELQVNMSVNTLAPVSANIKIIVLSPRNDIFFGKTIEYAVRFPIQDVLPKLTLIKFNNRVLCNGYPDPLEPGIIQTSMWAKSILTTFNELVPVQPTTQKPANGFEEFYINFGAQPGDLAGNPFLTNNFSLPFIPNRRPDIVVTQAPKPSPSTEATTSRRPVINTTPRLSDQCGVTKNALNLIIGGEDINPGDFPWLTAIMYRQNSDYKFHCTGNLLSDKHVLTAGHCVRYHNAPLFANDDVILVFGKLNIENWASGATLRNPSLIATHPNYKQDQVDYDIALIVLKETVRFRLTIRPICLWEGDDKLENVVGRYGSVVGWKKGEGDDAISTAQKLEMPIISQENCLRSHKVFKKYTSPRTFCAGNRDSVSGPCTGDSGAGFMIKDDATNKWYLRGLVGFSIRNPDTLSCDLSYYTVFIDVAKLRPWIRQEMNKNQ
ncbi:hypothetical protein Trydic_g2465 [Trypoxylus dichotomus]